MLLTLSFFPKKFFVYSNLIIFACEKIYRIYEGKAAVTLTGAMARAVTFLLGAVGRNKNKGLWKGISLDINLHYITIILPISMPMGQRINSSRYEFLPR